MSESWRVPLPYVDDNGVELVTVDENGFSTLTPAGVEYQRAELLGSWQTFIPRRFAAASLDSVADDVRGELERWVANVLDGTPSNLLLMGPVGTGKTHAALAAAREVFFVGKQVGFFPVVDLLDNLRPGRAEVDQWGQMGVGDIAYYRKPDLLVLDDLGGEKATDWTFERLYSIVNRRWMDEKPTVGTTNLEPAELREAIGDRTYDRLRDGAVAVHLGGKSRRRPA